MNIISLAQASRKNESLIQFLEFINIILSSKGAFTEKEREEFDKNVMYVRMKETA